MKKIVFILFFIPVILFAQKFADKDYYLVDSLNLKELSKADRTILDSCLMKFHTSQNDTIKLRALSVICDNLMSEVWSEYQFKQYGYIEEVLRKDLSENEKNVVLLMKSGSLNNLGLIAEFQEGDLPKALDYYLKALHLFEELENKNGEAMMLNRIGTVYNSLSDTEEALNFFLKSLKIYEELGEENEIANPLNNLGSYYSGVMDYRRSLDYYLHSLRVNEKVNDVQGIGISLSNIGKLYIDMKELDKALIYFIKSVNLFKENNDKNGIALVLSNIGKIYYLQEDYTSALINAKQSFNISQEIGYPKRISISAMLLSDILIAQGNKAEALDYYKLHILMRDSISNETTKTDAIRKQSKFEYDKQKAIDDATYDKQLAIEQESKAKQKIVIYASAGGVTLLTFFLIFVANRLQVTRKQKCIIEEAHEELSEKNREILDSINYAKRIQSAILPADELVAKNLPDSFILYKPKAIVAGDFYWMEASTGDGTRGVSNEKNTTPITQHSPLILFAAADCTGHGVPGAMLSVVCHNALNRSVREFGLLDPGEILDKTREIVIDEFDKGKVEDDITSYVKDGMDIALCSLSGNTLQYSGANNPLWIIRDNDIIETKADKQPIGRFRRSDLFTTHVFELQKKDIVYIFSDGYVDQFGGEKGKKFKAKAFKELLLSIQEKTMKEQKAIIDMVFEDWKGDLEQIDDVCVIGVRV